MAISGNEESNAPDDRVSVKVPRSVGAELKELASGQNTSAGAVVESLLKMNRERRAEAHSGVLVTLGDRLARLEEAQALRAETTVELARCMVTLAARLDDGAEKFLRRLHQQGGGA